MRQAFNLSHYRGSFILNKKHIIWPGASLKMKKDPCVRFIKKKNMKSVLYPIRNVHMINGQGMKSVTISLMNGYQIKKKIKINTYSLRFSMAN